jgi:hypothetical protein
MSLLLSAIRHAPKREKLPVYASLGPTATKVDDKDMFKNFEEGFLCLSTCSCVSCGKRFPDPVVTIAS